MKKFYIGIIVIVVLMVMLAGVIFNLFNSEDIPVVEPTKTVEAVKLVMATPTLLPTVTNTPTIAPTVEKSIVATKESESIVVKPTETLETIVTVVIVATVTPLPLYEKYVFKSGDEIGKVLLMGGVPVRELWSEVDRVVEFSNGIGECRVIEDRCEIVTGECILLPVK